MTTEGSLGEWVDVKGGRGGLVERPGGSRDVRLMGDEKVSEMFRVERGTLDAPSGGNVASKEGGTPGVENDWS